MNPEEVARAFKDLSCRFTGGEYRDEIFRYRLLEPRSSTDGERFPLVVFLHGAGERGADNLLQLKYLPAWLAAADRQAKHPCFLLAPQCRPGKTWSGTPTRDDPTEQLQVVIQVLNELLKRNDVDTSRVYLTGLSMGGFGCWELAARAPGRFAALAPICGGGSVENAQTLVDIPTWAVHGADDQVVPVSESRSMVAALRRLGGKPQYTEFRTVGHDSWTPAYLGNPEDHAFTGDDPRGFLDWMFSRRRTFD